MPAININDKIYNEFIIRKGKSVDVGGWIENIVEDFLERTKFEKNIWSKEYLEKAEDQETEAYEKKYGKPDNGFFWKSLFLPNGTILKMHYKDQDILAEVRNQFIHYQGKMYNSPSLLASHIAAGTSRNAWRDFYIKRPGDERFYPANFLRTR